MTYRQLLAAIREAERRETEAENARQATYSPRRKPRDVFIQDNLESAADAAVSKLDEEIDFDVI